MLSERASSIEISLLRVGWSCQLAPRRLEPLFKCDGHSVGPDAEHAILGFDFLVKLVEVEHVDRALLVCDLDVAQVLLELHVDHLLSDFASELVQVDVDFNLRFFVAPAELRNFLRGHRCARLSSLLLHGPLGLAN